MALDSLRFDVRLELQSLEGLIFTFHLRLALGGQDLNQGTDKMKQQDGVVESEAATVGRDDEGDGRVPERAEGDNGPAGAGPPSQSLAGADGRALGPRSPPCHGQRPPSFPR